MGTSDRMQRASTPLRETESHGKVLATCIRLLRIFAMLLPLLVWWWSASVAVPQAWLGVVEGRMLAIVCFALVFWILEPIPVFATSVAVVFLQAVFISDSAFHFLRSDGAPSLAVTQGAALEGLLDYKDLFHSFAAPVIMLFLGGFFLSGAATKYGLDRNLARLLLKPFGNRVETVTLGLMLITAFFSLWMANTPVTAMMLAIAAPVLNLFDDDDPGRVALLLGIPVASSLGGMGTPVGTPINAIALKYLSSGQDISFGKWMLTALPFVVIMLLVSWRLLCYLFPSRLRTARCDFDSSFDRSPHAWVVYIVFASTIVLWLTTSWHGLNIYTVALFPVTAFVVTGVITRHDLKKMSWDVLWLIAGGIALGVGLEGTGLTRTLVDHVPFEHFSPVLLMLAASALGFLVSTIMSHTATANLLMPVVTAVATATPALAPWGGSPVVLFGVALAISLGMALPISTPCNALAYAAGGVSNKQMLLGGGLVSLIGFAGLCALLVVLGSLWSL